MKIDSFGIEKSENTTKPLDTWKINFQPQFLHTKQQLLHPKEHIMKHGCENLFIVLFCLSPSLSFIIYVCFAIICTPTVYQKYIKSPVGKEEERAMFQQMQAMAQKQVNIEPFAYTLCFILI